MVWDAAHQHDVFVNYTCRNCGKTTKTFALWVVPIPPYDARIYKYGEYPQFGPPTPSRLLSLIREDRDLFLKGRRCENQDLGIAAFGDYRRVVEHEKGRIFGEIKRVAQKLNAPAELMRELDAAAQEKQFTKAVGAIKQALPQALWIDGHNPLTLLHDALSEGLHNDSDEECLELATAIRVVLTELAERAAQALSDQAELKEAVGRLLQKSRVKQAVQESLADVAATSSTKSNA
jgi:hypothetical protein